MTDTPGELTRNARRIAQETAALIDDDRGYRERVLTSLVRLETKMDGLQESFKAHVNQDDERFSAVGERFGTTDQRINTNSSWISKGAGILAAVVVMLGLITWLLDRVSP